MKKFITLLTSMTLMFTLLAGCSSETDETTAETTTDATETVDAPKVAVILEGPISDMSFNAAAYNGLLKIEEMGAEISYQESVNVASLPDSVATYATEGFDLIYLSTSSYTEAGLEIAPQYPEVQFVLISGSDNAENVSTVQVADEHQGFLMGAAAALVSETKKVGFIGGMEITPIVAGSKGFLAGVEYVNNGTEANVVMTGSFDDVNKAKETAKAMIDSGVDVLVPLADQAGLGVMEAAEEAGVLAVASGSGFETKAPNATVLYVAKDTSKIYEATYNDYLNGTLSDEIVRLGADADIVYVAEIFNDTLVTEEVQAKLNEIYEGLKSGEITVNID